MVVTRKDVAVVENFIFLEPSSFFSAFETGMMIMRMCCFFTRVSKLEERVYPAWVQVSDFVLGTRFAKISAVNSQPARRVLILDCRNVLLEGSCLWVLGVIECGAAAAVHLSMSAVDATKDVASGFKRVFGKLGVGARISARAQTLCFVIAGATVRKRPVVLVLRTIFAQFWPVRFGGLHSI